MPENEISPLPQGTPSLEELTSDGQGAGLEVESVEAGEVTIQKPFDPSKIDVVTQARTIDLLLTRLREGELNLSPEFQRRSNIWDDRRKSSLIESLLLRIPIPSLYVSEDKNGDYTVVDGLQRLCAIAHFVDVAALNRSVQATLNPLRLTGLPSLFSDYKDRTFSELPRPLQRRISETELTLHIIRASTPDAVKFNIFSRINQGGLPLTAQEIRNALYSGKWAKHVREMAESNEFLEATEHRVKIERMEDVELALRFVAHYTFKPDRPDEQNLDDFLNDTVKERSLTWSDEDWGRVRKGFTKALLAASQVFGRHAFRKYYGPGEARRPINRGLFETQTVLLARRNEQELKTLAERSEAVLTGFAKLMSSNTDFISALLYATGRGSSSNKRLQLINTLFEEVLNA